jgi:hypothetical protein
MAHSEFTVLRGWQADGIKESKEDSCVGYINTLVDGPFLLTRLTWRKEGH